MSNIDRESIVVYLFLKNEYAKSDGGNNAVFQFVFRSYYGLDGAGLSGKFKKRFFKLLEQKENNLKTILKKLYDIPTLRGRKTVQFVFATKLLHTLDNKNPIFDSRIGKVINRKVIGITGPARIKSSISTYKYLEYIHHNLLREGKIKKIIRRFREEFHVNEEQIIDSKILDFIIWTLGKLKVEDEKAEKRKS